MSTEIKKDTKETTKKKSHHLWELFLDDYYEPENKFFKFGKHTLRIFVGAIKKFANDEGILRAASISYSLIVSFIPTLVVVLLVGARFINKEEYYMIAKEFVRKNNFPVDLDPYFDMIDQILVNTNAMASVGILVILFSATAVLRNMEKALNRIWRVKKGRPWVQKISGFILVLLFGPILMTLGVSVGDRMVSKAAAPNILMIKDAGDKMFLMGDKGLLAEKGKNDEWKSIPVVEYIEYAAQKEPVLFKKSEERLLTKEEMLEFAPKIKKVLPEDMKNTIIQDVAVGKKNVWAVTSDGSLLSAKKGGNDWRVRRFQRENLTLLFQEKFTKIVMHYDGSGFIFGRSGLVLNTEDFGETWIPGYVEGINQHLTDVVEVSDKTYVAVGNGFSAAVSYDGGKNWKSYNNVMQLHSKDNEDLNDIYKSGKNIWITGDIGTLLFSNNSGKTWKRREVGFKNIDFLSIVFINDNSGALIYESGVISTSDAGENWKSVDANMGSTLHHAHFNEDSKKVMIVGNGYSLYQSKENNVAKYESVLNAPFWRDLVFALGSVILPFLVIGIVFFLIYKILPFTEVSNKASLLGAAVTSMLWVTFLWVFKSYALLFTKGTLAVYGTLAAIPVTLLLVYISAAIMLFGAEIGFFIQNPSALRLSHKKVTIDSEKRQIWYGMRFLQLIFENFDKGKGSTSKAVLVKACNNDFDVFYSIMERYEEKGIIEKTIKGNYLPAVNDHNLKLADLIDDLDPIDYSVPNIKAKDAFWKEVKSLFDEIKKKRQDIVRSSTFEDVLHKSRLKKNENSGNRSV